MTPEMSIGYAFLLVLQVVAIMKGWIFVPNSELSGGHVGCLHATNFSAFQTALAHDTPHPTPTPVSLHDPPLSAITIYSLIITLTGGAKNLLMALSCDNL